MFFKKLRWVGNGVQGRPGSKAPGSSRKAGRLENGRKLKGQLPRSPRPFFVRVSGHVAARPGPQLPEARARSRQFGCFLLGDRRGHGGPTAPGGGAAAAAGGTERVRGELLPYAGGGDGVPGLEPGSAGPGRAGGGGGEGCGRAGSFRGPRLSSPRSPLEAEGRAGSA